MTTTIQKQPQLSSPVVGAALSNSFSRKPQISAAQARCLDMQQKQHEAEMQILDIKKSNISSEHKRIMEVIDAEFEYWERMNKAMKDTQGQPQKLNTQKRR